MSAWSRRIPVIVLSLAGVAVAVSLTLFQVHVLDTIWEPFFGDGSRRVLMSSFSKALPVPDASLGALAYAAEVVLESLGGTQRAVQRPWLVVTAGVVAAGLGAAALVLIAIQALVLGAFCTLCLGSAALSLLVAGLVAPEVAAALRTIGARRSRTADAAGGGGASRHAVRPRMVWGGLALALAGAVTVAAGIAVLSWTISLIGTAVLLAGAAVGVLGGALYDARPVLAARKEWADVLGGRAHRGVAPGDRVASQQALADAAAAGRRTRALTAPAHRITALPLARLAGWVLILMSVIAVLLQTAWAVQTPTGRMTSVRDGTLVAILGLCGLRLALVPHRHRVAGTVALLLGLALLVTSVLAPHDSRGAVAVEVTAGALAVLGGLAAWLSPWKPEEPN